MLMNIIANNWQKLGAISLLVLMNASYAETFVISTNGGAALQGVVQHELNQYPNGGHVLVYQDKLIVNTTPHNYTKISQFIRQIDRMPQTLTVSVKVGENSQNAQNTGYGNIDIINSRVYVNGQWHNRQSQTVGNQVYQVQTLSGKPATIGLSQLMPVNTVNDHYHHGYPQVWIGQTLLTANQGIAVTPTRLTDGQVQVDIAQANDRFDTLNQPYNRQTVVNGQHLSTTVTVNPNQWTTIGYVNNQSQSNGTYGGYSQNLQTPIQIMVR